MNKFFVGSTFSRACLLTSCLLLLAALPFGGCSCDRDPDHGQNGEDPPPPNGQTTCTIDDDCGLGEVCADGVCVPYDFTPTPEEGCVADTDCADDERCAAWSGHCVRLADTQPPPDRPHAVCIDGDARTCGVSKVGDCRLGLERCVDGQWSGTCEGNVDPQPERCDGRDNDCDGVVDNGTDALCDDGDPCTGSGACVDGGCVNLDPVDCSHLDDGCLVGACDPTDGSCSAVPVTDGTACVGTSLCAAATCQAGECVLTGEPLDCSELDSACSVGVCDPATGTCSVEAINEGESCDDGDLCSEGSTCQAGTCAGATPVDCTGEDDACNVGVCDPETGACVQEPANEFQACDDGNLCTGDGYCESGTCFAGAPVDCTGYGDQCNVGQCDPGTGACIQVAANEGATCDDGDGCNLGTTCQAGACEGGTPRDCADWGDPQCAVGLCDSSTGDCYTEPINEGLACDDGDLCTEDSTCQAGTCAAGTAVDCSGEDDDCNVGVCDPSSGACQKEPANDFLACDDGNLCTGDGYCEGGTCFDGAPVDCAGYGDQCNEGQCDPETGDCIAVAANEGANCDDGDGCNLGTTCQSGACAGGTPRDCSDWADPQCADGLCDSSTGDCYTEPINEGQGCDDGDLCTEDSTCQGGTCETGTPVDCGEFDEDCRVGTCDPATGFCYGDPVPLEGVACDDGVTCTEGSVCSGGTCPVGDDMDCSYLNDSCHIGECNAVLDACEAIQVVDPCLTVEITAGPEAQTWSSDAIFEFVCSDPPCEYECRVDGGEWMPCDSPEEYTGFAVGSHTFEVRARPEGSGGEWSDPAQWDWEVYLPTCEDAAAAQLYIGCEYWPVVLFNPVANKFRDHVAVVVSNPLPGTTATVSLFNASSATPISQTTVPGNELRVLYLPWNAFPDFWVHPNGTIIQESRRGQIAYRLESDIPVNAYQFSPLVSHLPSGCTQNSHCPRHPNESCDASTGVCSVSDYSFSNDASLLLPAHVFRQPSQYVVPALPHMRLNNVPYSTLMAVVATEDGTNVRIRSRGHTAGGDVPELNPGSDVTLTLNRHEVVQFVSRPGGTAIARTAVPSNYGTAYEYPDSDLTGSLIDADKPIALFSGATCRLIPFNYLFCDHIQQQVFPLETLGHAYIGAVATPPGGSDPASAPVKGDVWRLLAVQNGTQVTFDPPTVHGNVTLSAGDWIEFESDTHFHVSSQSADHPILLSQYLVSEQAHGGNQGDPSMILPVPVAQYRQQYAFTTPQEIANHHVNIVRPAGTVVRLNGNPVAPGCWEPVGSSGYEVCRTAISEGVHSLAAGTGVGLIVYGYDSYVSYGYTGGLGLLPTTAINPDW